MPKPLWIYLTALLHFTKVSDGLILVSWSLYLGRRRCSKHELVRSRWPFPEHFGVIGYRHQRLIGAREVLSSVNPTPFDWLATGYVIGVAAMTVAVLLDGHGPRLTCRFEPLQPSVNQGIEVMSRLRGIEMYPAKCCEQCGEWFTTEGDRQRHRVVNLKAAPGERWCLSKFGMEAVGLVATEREGERFWSFIRAIPA